jgi:hypothetical protein
MQLFNDMYYHFINFQQNYIEREIVFAKVAISGNSGDQINKRRKQVFGQNFVWGSH